MWKFLIIFLVLGMDVWYKRVNFTISKTTELAIDTMEFAKKSVETSIVDFTESKKYSVENWSEPKEKRSYLLGWLHAPGFEFWSWL